MDTNIPLPTRSSMPPVQTGVSGMLPPTSLPTMAQAGVTPFSAPPQSSNQQPVPMRGGVAQAPMQPSQIDEQWIALAKDVVSKTSEDPYLQNRELAKVKAGYLRARYGKEIKVSEDNPR